MYTRLGAPSKIETAREIQSSSRTIVNARRRALSLAAAMEFDELRQGQLGIIVTEAARNIKTHAGQGEILPFRWKQ